MRTGALVTAVLLATAHPAAAQRDSWSGLIEGARVRITPRASGARPLTGTVAMVAPDTLYLRRGMTTLDPYPYATMARLELRLGRNQLKGMLLGAALGIAAGAGIGALVPCETTRPGAINCSGDPRRGSGYSNVALGALLGGLVGSVVGRSALAPARWVRLPLPLRVSVVVR
jgi:hypothetical protein